MLAYFIFFYAHLNKPSKSRRCLETFWKKFTFFVVFSVHYGTPVTQWSRGLGIAECKLHQTYKQTRALTYTVYLLSSQSLRAFGYSSLITQLRNLKETKFWNKYVTGACPNWVCPVFLLRYTRLYCMLLL